MRCPKCLESWDTDSAHDEVSSRWPNEPWKVSFEELPICEWCNGTGIRTSLEYPHREVEPFKCNGCYGRGRTNSSGNGPLYYDQNRYEKYFHEVIRDFKKRGCVALGGSPQYCVESDNLDGRAAVYALHDLLGDDVDAINSMEEDAEMMGLL